MFLTSGNWTLLIATLILFYFLSFFFISKLLRMEFSEHIILSVSYSFIYLIILYINITFFDLMYSFLNSDFTLSLVTSNSNFRLPLLYKWSGLWGNHEGSMLLWCWIISIYIFFFIQDIQKLNISFQFNSFIFCFSILFFYFSFLLFTSNPFLPNPFFYLEGKDLNPILQDPGLVIHPPILYLGYIAIIIPFCLVLLTPFKNIQFWKYLFKKWVLLSWIFLTIGIGLGSWWAYYELGWGGWWFWDPVENAALMPWILLTSMLHSKSLSSKTLYLDKWTYIMTIFLFLYSLLGTFFVRSGLFTSVHSFANNSTRGYWLLFFAFIFLLVSLFQYFKYYSRIKRTEEKKKKRNFFYISLPYDSKFGLIWNHLLSFTALFAITLGTFLPIIYKIIYQKEISIGSPYFEENVIPIFFSYLLLLTFFSFSHKKSQSFSEYFKQLPYKEFIILFNIITSSLLLYFVWKLESNFILYIYIIYSILYLSMFIPYFYLSFPQILPKDLAHFFFWFLGGIVLFSSTYEKELLQWIDLGDQLVLKDYIFTFRNIHEYINTHFYTLYGNVTIEDKIAMQTSQVAFPEKRFYFLNETLSIKSVILSGFYEDMYIMIGEGSLEDGWFVRIFNKPFMIWLWIGWLFLIGCGLFSYHKNHQNLKKY